MNDDIARWTCNHSINSAGSWASLAIFLRLQNSGTIFKYFMPEDLSAALLESLGLCALTHLKHKPVYCFHLTNSPCGVFSDIRNCLCLLIRGLLQRINRKPCWGFQSAMSGPFIEAREGKRGHKKKQLILAIPPEVRGLKSYIFPALDPCRFLHYLLPVWWTNFLIRAVRVDYSTWKQCGL